jgi:hypothetical protein
MRNCQRAASSEGGRQCRIVKLLVRKDLRITKLPDEDPSCAGTFAGGADPASKLSQRHDGITIYNPLIWLECFYIHGLENRLEEVRDPFFP